MTGRFCIAPLRPQHRADWDALYCAYAEFYKSAQTPDMRDTVWGWLQDDAHELNGLLAIDDHGSGIGLAHYRPFARPLASSVGGFLDDLFVRPHSRGRGVAAALISAVADEGRRRGWTVVRWITAEDNLRARTVYDRVAEKTHWVTYQIPLL